MKNLSKLSTLLFIMAALAACNNHDSGSGSWDDAGVNNNVNTNTNSNTTPTPAGSAGLNIMSLGRVAGVSLEASRQFDFIPASEDAMFGPVVIDFPGGVVVVGRDHVKIESPVDAEFHDVPLEQVQNYEQVMRAAGLIRQGMQPDLFPSSVPCNLEDPSCNFDLANLLRGFLCSDGIDQLDAARWCPSVYIPSTVFRHVKTGREFEWELHGYNKVVFVLFRDAPSQKRRVASYEETTVVHRPLVRASDWLME